MVEKIIKIATLGTNVHTQCVVCLTSSGRLFNATRYHGSDDFKWEEMTLPDLSDNVDQPGEAHTFGDSE